LRRGIYPGTFDPITNGHLDLIRRSFKVVDRLIVGVSRSTPKSPFFSIDERVEMIRKSVDRGMPVEVEAFEGLLVDFAARKKASVIIRGLRALSDFEYEFQMALMNKQLNKEIEVLFMVPDVSFTYLSSTIVREVVELGGDVSDLVPKPVLSMLRERHLVV
jgi:pantetheine-phosphate adenylyltransferase